jgi:hypothetical protein
MIFRDKGNYAKLDRELGVGGLRENIPSMTNWEWLIPPVQLRVPPQPDCL